MHYGMLFFGQQKQPNHYDCGLFGIGNAIAICTGQSPEDLSYNTKVMRKHLVGCLEDKVIRPFPASKRSIKQRVKRSEILKVYCTCRLPEGGERMIACDNCGEWYHENCLKNIPSEAWNNCSYKWTCDFC